MTYKLLNAVHDVYGDWYDIEIKNNPTRFVIISRNSKIEIIGVVSALYLNTLTGTNITSQGIPEDLKNYLEDPFFEIELEKLICSQKS